MSMMRWSTQSGSAEADIYLQETGGNTLGKDDRASQAFVIGFYLFIALSYPASYPNLVHCSSAFDADTYILSYDII